MDFVGQNTKTELQLFAKDTGKIGQVKIKL